ncbi:hypothetical protein FHL15_001206 [Xylaria flabelliformis]|uniref:Uncharacterized protein n=1 Tax=Xylaria flabelliformis TaxID=2512241 RepID=A0A553ICT3_9PEZI|nr:hypothetical protein FHL15_001206 [Xylaria flabelliformis]
MMYTCIDLFALRKFFSLERLWKHYGISNGDIDEIQPEISTLSSIYLGSVHAVFSSANSDSKLLRETLVSYLELARYVVRREEFLGETMRTDSKLATFLADILKATLFGPFVADGKCSQCKNMANEVEVGGPIIGQERLDVGNASH